MKSFLQNNFITQQKHLLFFLFLTFIFAVKSPIYAQKKDFVVVLDAGHGGKDPGKVGYHGFKEKDIALSIVLKIGNLLENSEKNIKVIYTRKTDKFVDLWERGRIANRADANLFVSIHCNAHKSDAKGAETWVLGTHANNKNFEVAKTENSVILLEDNYKNNYKGFDPNSPESVIGITLMQEEYLDQSIQLASIIQHNLTTDIGSVDRGVKQAGFVVLYQTYMPSVLVETGFITNPREGKFLDSSKGQNEIANSIEKGILKYKSQLELNSVGADTSVATSEGKNQNSPEKDSSNQGIIFKVQIAVSSRKVETKSYNFKGLENVERLKIDKKYKYFYGNSTSYNDILKSLKRAQKTGYKSAFIIAFKNNEIISITDTMKKS